MSPWEEVEKDPEFSTLAPQDKAALFDDWHKTTVEDFHKELDPEQIDSAGMRGFLASGQAKRRELLGEPVAPEQAVKEFDQSLQARSKAQQQTLNDYDELEKSRFALKDAAMTRGVTSSEDRGMPMSPRVTAILDKPQQEAQAKLDELSSRFTPETEQQAKEAREALRGERPAAVLGSDIYTDPSLVLDKEKYRQAVQSTSASPEAKLLALADFNTRRDEFAKKALSTFNTAGESPVPGMTSFAKWESEQPAEVRAKTPEAKALDYMRTMQARPDFRKLVSAVGTGAIQGGADVANQGIGLAAMASGSDALAKKAGEVEKGTQALSDVQKLEGDNTATGATTVGGISRLGVGMAPAIGAGVATGGSLTAAALAAGAQTAGAQFPTTYNAMIKQGKTPEEALSASRGAAVLSGGITAALTAMGGYNGVEALIRRGGMGAARSKLKSVLLTGPLKEIAEELPDEQASQIIESSLTNPDKPVSQVVDEFMAKAPDLALQVGLLGGAGEAFSKQGAPATPATPAEQQRTPVNSAGLGRTVGEVVAEADALKAKAQQQAVESGSPLLAQAIAENVAAPTPEAQTGETGKTAEPSETQEPGAAGQTTEPLSDTEVKATEPPVQISPVTTEAATPLEQGGSNQHAGESRTPTEGSISDVTTAKMADNKSLSTINPEVQGVVTLQPEQLSALTPNVPEWVQAQKDNQTPARESMDLNKADPIMVIRQKDGTLKVAQGHHRLARALRDNVPLRVDIQNEVSTKPTKSIPDRINESSLSPRTTYPTLVQDIKALTGNTASKLQEAADALLPEPMTRPTAEKIARRLMEDNAVQREAGAARERALERDRIREEKAQRGDERPVSDDKAPVTQGDFVTWQDENGAMREGVLTKASAGRGSLGEPMSEVTLEDSQTVQVSRRELQPLMASLRRDGSNGPVLPSSDEYLKNVKLTGREESDIQQFFRDFIAFRNLNSSPFLGPVEFGSSRPPAAYLGRDGRVTVHLGIPEGGNAFTRNGSEELVKKRLADLVDEEIIHAADLVALSKTWDAAGRPNSINQFVYEKTQAVLSELASTYPSLSTKDQAVLTALLNASDSLYNQQSTSRTFEEWMAHLQEDNQQAIPVLNELVRQLVQLHQTDDITETGWKRIAGALSEWLKKLLKILNIGSQKVRDGVFGDILKQRIAQTEEQLDTLTSEKLKASSRGNPVQASRAEAIESLRGHLGKEVSVGVSAVDAINGAAELQGDVPGVQKAWVGTSDEFLADEGLRKAFPQVNQAMMSPDSSRFEGLFSGGRAFVFTDNVGIYEADIESAGLDGMSPGQAAVQRVITHEALVHRGFYALDKPTRQALLRWGEQNIYEGEMDAKAEEYGVGANWRSDVGSREWLMEEIMAKMIERLKAPPKSGPLKQLWDILASIWRKLTGRSREVTLKDIHDVAKLLRTALELAENNVQTRDGMPIKVEVVKPSMREMIIYRAGDTNENGIKPWASFTPDEETAKTYTDNPGFGGPHVRSLRVYVGKVLDLTGTRAFEKLASALGYNSETAQEWRDNGWNYPWEESSKIKRALEDSEYDAVKYTDDFPAGATTIVFTRQPQQVDDVKPSIRPAYTSPLDQTLANTAKAVRLMRDGPPAVPVNLQEVYRKAQVGKSSAMVSLDDMFAEAKKAHPDLTEAEFGQQVQALYDDNGAYIEPADSPTVMREAGEKYNVRMLGVPASYVMVLDDVPVRASLAPETASRLNRVVEAAQTASGGITESEQTPIKDRPVHTFAQQSGEARVDAAVQIVDALEAEGNPKEELVDKLNSYELQKQLGIEKDPDMLSILMAEAMRRGAPGAFDAYEVTRERAGRALGSGAMIHSHPRYQHLFVLNGIKKEHQQQANDIAEANADIKTDEVKKLVAESGRTADQELADDAMEAAFREGEEALNKENKTLWQNLKDWITEIGVILQIKAARKAKADKNAAKPSASLAGVVSQARYEELNNLSDDQLDALFAKRQKDISAAAKKMLGKDPKAKANPDAGRIATMVNRLSEQLGVPTDITSAVEALTASQDSLKNQFEQSIVDSLVGKVRSAITPKKTPSKNLNSVIKQITRILADNLNLPKITGATESLGEKAIDAFGRVRNNEQLIREAWEKAREQIRATLAKRATEGLESLTEEEAADIEQQMDDQLAAIAAEVPAHLWARGQAFSVLRDALAETAFDNNEKIMDNPEGALKAAQDKINEAVEKVGNVDPARWESNQPYIIAAFNQLVADLRAAKAKSNARRRAAQRAGVFSPAETETFNRLMDAARKRSGDKTPLLPENISWGKLFSSSPQSQEAKAKSMMEYMKADPVLSSLTTAEQQELADMFAKQWEAKRTALTEAKVAAVLKRRHATAKGKEAVKGAIPKFIQAINRGELNNDIIAQDIAEKFGFQKLTDDENKKLETLAKELQQPDIPVNERRAKTDEIVKIIARKTGLSTAEILSAWWVTSVLSGPRTIFTIGMAFLSGGFEVFTHAMATVINAHLQGRRSEGTDAAMQSITNYFKSYPRAVQLAWQYVRTGDKNLLADSDPAFMQFFDTGRNNPQSIGWRMTQSKNPATRMLGRFMHFFEKMLTAGDLFNSTITRHGMLPVAQFLNSKTYEKARVASETDLASYRKKVLDQWWGGEEPKTWQQQALVTRQAIDLMEAVLAKYANVLEDANFVAAQGAMTLNPEGFGGGFYKVVRGIANRAETASAKYGKYVDKLKPEEVGKTNLMVQQAIAVLYHFATHQMLNVAGLRFARFAGNKLNQSIGFVPLLGLARLYEKDYAGQIKSQAIIKNQVIGAAITMVGITILKAVSDEPDDEKRGWGIEGSWKGLSADKIKQLMAAGRKQNSIHFGEHTFNYANWPISSVLAAFGAMTDRIKYNPKDWKEASSLEVAYTGLWAALKSTFETTALSQLAEIFGSNIHSRDPVDASMKQMSRIFGNFAGGFVPRIFKDADLLQDGKLRKYEGWENFAKEIPFYRRYVGGPLLDIFGKQVEVSSTPWSREYLAQPEAREYRLLGQLGSNGLWLTPADPANRRVGRGKRSREMTDAEQKRFVTFVGNNYRDLVLKHGERLTKMPHENAKELMGKLSAAARDRAERAALVAPATQP